MPLGLAFFFFFFLVTKKSQVNKGSKTLRVTLYVFVLLQRLLNLSAVFFKSPFSLSFGTLQLSVQRYEAMFAHTWGGTFGEGFIKGFALCKKNRVRIPKGSVGLGA